MQNQATFYLFYIYSLDVIKPSITFINDYNYLLTIKKLYRHLYYLFYCTVQDIQNKVQ